MINTSLLDRINQITNTYSRGSEELKKLLRDLMREHKITGKTDLKKRFQQRGKNVTLEKMVRK